MERVLGFTEWDPISKLIPANTYDVMIEKLNIHLPL